jgi:hypothetical protein
MRNRGVLARLRAAIAVDPRSLALLRMGLGVLLLANLVGRAAHFEALYGQPGVLPTSLLPHLNLPGQSLFFAYLVSGTPVALGLAAGASALFAVGLALGCYTRTCTLASWFLLVSLNTRNPLATSYEDSVLQALLFWGIFLPLGAAWSLDARRSGAPPARAPVASAASCALLLQFAAIYFFGALHKTGPAWHADADAVYYTLAQNYVARPIAAALRDQPGAIALLTRLTWHWELSFPLLVFSPLWNGPLRTFAVATVWAFHAGLWVCLALALFPPVMMLGALGLLPPWLWQRLAGGVAAAADPPARGGAAALAREGVPAALILLLLAGNLASLPGAPALPRGVAAVARVLGLDQGWRMYAPEPQKSDFYHVMPGTLADGRRVDLARGGAPLAEGPPATPPWRDPSRPWSLHLERVRTYGPHIELGLPLASWMCRSWNATHAGPERLVTFAWVVERFDLEHDRKPASDHLGTWRCAEGPGDFTQRVALPP